MARREDEDRRGSEVDTELRGEEGHPGNCKRHRIKRKTPRCIRGAPIECFCRLLRVTASVGNVANDRLGVGGVRFRDAEQVLCSCVVSILGGRHRFKASASRCLYPRDTRVLCHRSSFYVHLKRNRFGATIQRHLIEGNISRWQILDAFSGPIRRRTAC